MGFKEERRTYICEGKDGDYLPFKPLVELKGVAGKVNKEVVFYKRDFIEDANNQNEREL